MGYSNRVLPGEFRGGIPFTVSLDGRLLLERASTFHVGKGHLPKSSKISKMEIYITDHQ